MIASISLALAGVNFCCMLYMWADNLACKTHSILAVGQISTTGTTAYSEKIFPDTAQIVAKSMVICFVKISKGASSGQSGKTRRSSRSKETNHLSSCLLPNNGVAAKTKGIK